MNYVASEVLEGSTPHSLLPSSTSCWLNGAGGWSCSASGSGSLHPTSAAPTVLRSLVAHHTANARMSGGQTAHVAGRWPSASSSPVRASRGGGLA